MTWQRYRQAEVEVEHQQHVQSVVVAHRLLGALAERSGGTSLTELARALDMNASRVLRHLATLVELQLVERAEGEPVYRLGIGLVRLAERAAGQHDVSRIAVRALRRLNDDFGQATFLVRRQGDHAAVWLSFEGYGAPQLTMPPGMTFALSGSACGRVLLAFDPDPGPVPLSSQIDDQFPDPLATRDTLEARLALIRAAGFDQYGADRANAIYSLAAPVLNHRERAVAAIGIVGLSAHYAALAPAMCSALLEAASEVSNLLGSRARTMPGMSMLNRLV